MQGVLERILLYVILVCFIESSISIFRGKILALTFLENHKSGHFPGSLLQFFISGFALLIIMR